MSGSVAWPASSTNKKSNLREGMELAARQVVTTQRATRTFSSKLNRTTSSLILASIRRSAFHLHRWRSSKPSAPRRRVMTSAAALDGAAIKIVPGPVQIIPYGRRFFYWPLWFQTCGSRWKLNEPVPVETDSRTRVSSTSVLVFPVPAGPKMSIGWQRPAPSSTLRSAAVWLSFNPRTIASATGNGFTHRKRRRSVEKKLSNVGKSVAGRIRFPGPFPNLRTAACWLRTG